jgi:DNA-binding IclR family transcriptional regulator
MRIQDIKDPKALKRLWLLAYLPTEPPGMHVLEVAEAAGIGPWQASNALRYLRYAGLVEQHSWGRYARYTAKFRLTLEDIRHERKGR